MAKPCRRRSRRAPAPWPYLLDRRNANLFEAVATPVAAVRLNARPMALWAALIVFLVAVGMVPGLLGLAIAVPVVGHATWHAYRDIVIFPDDEARPPQG